MHHYHHRAFYLGVLSVALIAVGLLALKFPVFIDSFDQWGWQIKCGTGFSSDLTQAAAASGGDNYVGQCETALMVRRIWAIPMVAVARYFSPFWSSLPPPFGAGSRCSVNRKAPDLIFVA